MCISVVSRCYRNNTVRIVFQECSIFTQSHFFFFSFSSLSQTFYFIFFWLLCGKKFFVSQRLAGPREKIALNFWFDFQFGFSMQGSPTSLKAWGIMSDLLRFSQLLCGCAYVVRCLELSIMVVTFTIHISQKCATLSFPPLYCLYSRKGYLSFA
ncbi:hypothetical protein CLIB1423_06S05402 [[Candida] railenensis]|uniref:Uncharacterized protein n=1 Tax=[Candida] railenensis TaxID=45579 RepID=A0A9P0QPU2_9ASCO|nr:hypothetical protein CLIB1423_06S05402 [[Candida] railenensis]